MNKKADLYTLNDLGIDFHDFCFVKMKPEQGKMGKHGTRYVLDSITEAQKEALSQYKNVLFSECHCRYAPEITYTTVIIWNR